MKKLKYMAGLAAIASLVSSCNNSAKQADKPRPTPQDFAQPLVAEAPASSLPLPSIPLQGTVQVAGNVDANPKSTPVNNRDPFASLPNPDMMVGPQLAAKLLNKSGNASHNSIAAKPTAQPVSQMKGAAAPAPQKLAAAPTSFPLPKLAIQPVALAKTPMPAPMPIQPLPPMPFVPPSSSAPPPSLTSLADVVAVTGVVQMGGQWTAIVKEPDATPRYVQQGDYLANGQVLLKRIVMGANGSTTVILQQNGREVIKSLG